jgi:hypothetical protein
MKPRKASSAICNRIGAQPNPVVGDLEKSHPWDFSRGSPNGPSHLGRGVACALIAAALGDCRKMIYQDAQDFRSYSRRASRRIAGYVTAGTTQKTDEKTSRLVCHLTEIALVRRSESWPRTVPKAGTKAFSGTGSAPTAWPFALTAHLVPLGKLRWSQNLGKLFSHRFALRRS